ncbi:MAG: ISNCY family transposase [Gammaproteobacteria bacterium]|nr:ISNCY family transposase [Gammaproteobacteria bacterium]
MSYRQTKRIWQRYQQESDKGLCHKSRGKKASNAYSADFREKILGLYRLKYLGFGPTFAAEKMLEDDSLPINAETLRLWLKKEGLWTKKRKRVIYRERRANFGDLLQIDGSIHGWFSDERRDCLLNIVDDATGISFALIDTGETTQILLTCLKRWIEQYGIPKSVYVDLKSVYVSPKRLKEKYDDDLLIKEGFSYFEQACRKLGIEIIKAYSPQAKGRVERKHGVYQDRLVKDLKLYGIKTIEAANHYLEEKFLDKINQKFAQAPKEETDNHRNPKPYGDLDEILCWNYKRQLKNDWSIQFNREYFQVKRLEGSRVQPGEFIILKKYLDGNMRFWYEEQQLDYYPLSRKPQPPSRSKKYYTPKGSCDPQLRSMIAKKNKHKTPWSRFNGFNYSKNHKVTEPST